jgi:hypothetical protein
MCELVPTYCFGACWQIPIPAFQPDPRNQERAMTERHRSSKYVKDHKPSAGGKRQPAAKERSIPADRLPAGERDPIPGNNEARQDNRSNRPETP